MSKPSHIDHHHDTHAEASLRHIESDQITITLDDTHAYLRREVRWGHPTCARDWSSTPSSYKAVFRAATGELRSINVPDPGGDDAVLHLGDASSTYVVSIGPIEAADSDIDRGDTPSRTIDSSSFGEHRILAPIEISPWFRRRWYRYCRIIHVTGRVICPEGHPVPGAAVAVFDVDWLLDFDLMMTWTSRDQVGSAITDADGMFYIPINWCCTLERGVIGDGSDGWHVDERLSGLVNTVAETIANTDILRHGPDSSPSSACSALDSERELLPSADPYPSRDQFRWAVENVMHSHVSAIGDLRWGFPRSNDCDPDLTFKVTQNCHGTTQVLLDETADHARYGVDGPIYVNLRVASGGCCTAPAPIRPGIVFASVNGRSLDRTAGSVGASELGAHSGQGRGVSFVDDSDHWLGESFAGQITVTHEPSRLEEIDYYGFEYAAYGGTAATSPTWTPLSVASILPLERPFFTGDADAMSPIQFQTCPGIDTRGYAVFESLRRVELTHEPQLWSPLGPRTWLVPGAYDLLRLDTATLNDGSYEFRIVRFVTTADGNLIPDGPVLGPDGNQARFIVTLSNHRRDRLGL